MTTNTIDFYGTGFNSAETSILVQTGNTTIYEGTVSSVTESDPTKFVRADYPLIFSYDYESATGNLPISIKVTEGFGFVLSIVKAPFTDVYRSEITDEIKNNINTMSLADKITMYQSLATVPFSSDELAMLNDESIPFKPSKTIVITQHGAKIKTVRDIRNDVLVDGKVPESCGMVGVFECYPVHLNETIAFNIEIPSS